MTESLNVVDHSIYPPSLYLSFNVIQTIEYGIGVCVVAVLFGQRARRSGHSELTLHFIEDHPRSLLIQEAVEVLSKHRRYADVSEAEAIAAGLALAALGQELFQTESIMVMISVEVRT